MRVERRGEFSTGHAEGGTAAHLSIKTYLYHGSTFASERELVLRFLDDLRAAESFGAEVLALWAVVARDPVVSEGLKTICTRERSHGQVLARRLEEIGGARTAELSVYLKEASRERLASSDVPDLEKLRDFAARYPEVELAAKPIHDVIAQIEEDLESKALLSAIADDEMATQRWMVATFNRLTASSEETGTSRSELGQG